MAFNDIGVVDSAGYAGQKTEQWQTDAGTTAILLGEPVMITTQGSVYAALPADGYGVIGTSEDMLGIAQSSSTHTASVDGVVNVYTLRTGVVYSVKAKSSTAANTRAKILALQGGYYVLDLTAGVWTMDTAGGNGATNAFMIVGGDPESNTVYFQIRQTFAYSN